MTRVENQYGISVKTLATMAILGGLLLSLGAVMVPERVWSNLLIGLFALVTLGLGGALFLALTQVTGGIWSHRFRPISEAMATTLPWTALGLFVVLLLRMNQYGWHPHGGGDPGTYWFKAWWSTPSFWIGRAAAYLIVWAFLSRAIVSGSRKTALSGAALGSSCQTALSAFFLVVYAITFSLASCDWFMLLDPMWYSTIWGVYHFAGMFQATLAVMVLVGLATRSRGGPLHGRFTDDHLHDLGKLLLGFSCFWMYIWFSQYMLIWYTNIPEETSFYDLRLAGPWGPIMVVSLLLNWVVPFFVLLPRPCKRSSSVMIKVAVVVLLGRWVDLYTIVFPRTTGTGPQFGLWEIAGVFCLLGCFGILMVRAFSGIPLDARKPLDVGQPLGTGQQANLH